LYYNYYNTRKIPDGKYQISIVIKNCENEFSDKKGDSQILKVDSQILANVDASFGINFEIFERHGWAT